MDRRLFLKRLAVGAAGPIILNSIPINVLASNSPLMRMLSSGSSDRVLVFLQLHGGNDGLNTIVPIKNYSKYYELRSNIAIPDYGSRRYIPLDNSLADEDRVGLHPDMTGVKELYDSNRAAIVQSVGYNNMNLSHFRGRDIWFMGGDYNEHIPSGWMGRFLDEVYPGYPEAYPNDSMLDPLGLEMGNDISLAFVRENGIPAGISLSSPQTFFDLINSVGIDAPGLTSFPDSNYGRELEYLTKFEKKTNDFALRLKQVYDNGQNSPSVTYPSSYPLLAPIPYIKNRLAEQFKIVARLLKGGIKTRVFLVRITGFDTHADQVESTDPSQGRHAALLYHISESVKAFHNDLELLGLGNRVLTMTFSEFGRRVYSNASYGTDHGKAAPVLLFGNGLRKGVYGPSPDLFNLDNGNVPNVVDYRQVYTTVLSDWLGSSNGAIQDSGLGQFLDKKLGFIAQPLSSKPRIRKSEEEVILEIYPNPANDLIKVKYLIKYKSESNLSLYDSNGKLVKELIGRQQGIGLYENEFDVSDIPPGNYVLKFRNGNSESGKVLIKK
jgi:uncharacterized protein (DUF1501 family)